MTLLEQDSATRVVLVRHGQTAWNAQRRMQGQLDIALDDLGRWQAERLGQALMHEGLAAIYSSDLQRAQATARTVSNTTGLPVQIDSSLRERAFGVFEGRTYDEIAEQWPDGARRWRARDATFAPDNGETLAALYARSVQAASALCACHPGQAIALITHGGVLDCLYRAATQAALDAPRSWQLGNATVNRLLYTDQRFTLVGWNDDAHLNS